ncbi:MAG: hypothetical protein HY859_14670 [Caulobacterales bacterium]|nr:hypothetical protein [Caulobacterales bacterium]
MIFDFQKNGALLAAGIAIGAAGSMALGGLVKDIWRVTPFSAESKLEKTRDQLADMTGNWRAEKAAREARDVAIADRDKRLLAVGQEAAVDQSAAAERWGQQCQAAYRSGVAFGRALPKSTLSTGAPHAPAAPASPAGRPTAGRLQPSFRDSWATGAFDPAAAAASGGLSGAGSRRTDP